MNKTDAAVEYLDHVMRQSIPIQNLFQFSLTLVGHLKLSNLCLKHYGIRGIVNKWLRSFLEDRLRFVCFKAGKSKTIIFDIGVLQVSTPVPLLFSLFINDMKNSSKKLNLVHFADDTTAFLKTNDKNNNIMTIEKEYESMCVWVHYVRLTLNITKCSLLIHDNISSDQPDVCLSIRAVNLTKASQAKVLGIIIDGNLKLDDHADFVLAKLISATDMTYKKDMT